MLLPCVRPDQVSVAPVAARRFDCGQDVVNTLALVSKADRGPVGLDQTAVSVSRLVLGTRIDAEFLSDMGELFRVHETAVCHHRAQGR